MPFRRPENCPHETVTLDRRTGKEQCPWCGMVLAKGVDLVDVERERIRTRERMVCRDN